MKKILVAGVTGFVGHHLASELKKQGHWVIGSSFHGKVDDRLDDVLDEYINGCDLTKIESVRKLPISEIDAVVNLAGLAQLGTSFGRENLYNSINVRVHTVITQEILRVKPTVRVIAVSSGTVYDYTQLMPINENGIISTNTSPYAASKIAMEAELNKLAKQGADVIIARPFNHIGPGQLPGFLVPDLAQQVIKSDTINVGNLKTERDYTDVRDVVKAYQVLATTPKLKHRVYNICSGTSATGQTMLDYILKAVGKLDITVNVDPEKFRPNDPLRVVGDNTRLHQETGWEPEIKLEKTINDIVKTL